MTYINTYYLPIESDEQFEKHLAKRIDMMYSCHPGKPSEKLMLLSRQPRYVPAFHTSMTLDHWSYNTTGRAVHNEHQSVDLLMRASQLMAFDDSRLTDYILKNKKSTASTVPHDIESDGGADISFVVNTLIRELVKNNTYLYRYQGKNGQTYTRISDPSSRDVYVHNADIIYIVESHIEYLFSGREYSFDAIETQSPNFCKYINENHICEQCNKIIDWNGMICRECGKIIHKTHGCSCNLCGKSLCSSCASKYKKFLILTKHLCPNCVSMNPKIKIVE